MGKLLPFRRRKAPSSGLGPHGTGGLTGSRRLPQAARFGRPKRQRGAAFRWLRPWLLLAVFLLVAAIVNALPDPIPFLPGAGRQEVPALAWRACGDRRDAGHCVVDGDTVRIEGETIRLLGLDAPELAGACEAERIAARAARDALLGWLNRGAFTITGEGRDKYGRPLRRFSRGRAIGGSDAAGTLIAAGVARPYDGDGRAGWCG